MSHGIGAFTSVYEEDRIWVPQYLKEVERLKLLFVVHLDRCSDMTKYALTRHPRCVGFTEQNDPSREFDETQKQGAFDLLVKQGFRWAFAWDIDETFERKAKSKLRTLSGFCTYDSIITRWLNLWHDKEHIRVDGHFATGYRVKFYNLSVGPWKFTHKIVNGAKISHREPNHYRSDLVCLHHGMMTPALRILHKERWDRIYSTALRGDPNPYGFWRDAIETPAEVIKHAY